MRIEKITSEELNKYINEFENHIIYYFDSLEFGKGEINIDKENVNEAFLFSEGKCLHIYREDGVKGTLYVEEGMEEALCEEQLLKKGLLPENSSFSKIIVKKYISYDEDGQAYVERTLPSKII